MAEHARFALAEHQSRFANYVFDMHGGPDSVGLCGGRVDVHIDVAVHEFAAVARASLEVLASLVREGDVAPGHAGTRMLIWPDARTEARGARIDTLFAQPPADVAVAELAV